MFDEFDPALIPLRRRCWHEAGHAVVAWSFGRVIARVWVDIPEGNGGCDLIALEEPISDKEVQDSATIALAGRWAGDFSGIALEDGVSDDKSDVSRAWGELEERFGEEWIDAKFGWAGSEAERLVRENVDRIGWLAAVLEEQGTIEGDDAIRAIIEGEAYRSPSEPR
jgi:hypothetical protein